MWARTWYLLLLCLSCAYVKCDPIEDALLLFYNSTNGAYWNINSGWVSRNDSYCTWNGITCAGKGMPMRVNLQGNNLTGTVPNSFWNISSLTNVLLSQNKITGTLPSIQSKTLIEIAIQNNGFSGPFPDLSNVSSLSSLLVTSNKFNGTFPSWMFGMSSLVTFDISSNNFYGVIQDPANNNSNTQLSQFYVSGNSFSGVLPGNYLSTLKALTNLQLQGNMFFGVVPILQQQLSIVTLLPGNNFNCLPGSLASQIQGSTPCSCYFGYVLQSGNCTWNDSCSDVQSLNCNSSTTCSVVKDSWNVICKAKPPTATPTTVAPTTVPPTTVALTTMAATTLAPTVSVQMTPRVTATVRTPPPITTIATTTAPPTTEPPTTAAPTTEPETSAPTTSLPTTPQNTPTTLQTTPSASMSTSAPTTDIQTSSAPTTSLPGAALPVISCISPCAENAHCQTINARLSQCTCDPGYLGNGTVSCAAIQDVNFRPLPNQPIVQVFTQNGDSPLFQVVITSIAEYNGNNFVSGYGIAGNGKLSWSVMNSVYQNGGGSCALTSFNTTLPNYATISVQMFKSNQSVNIGFGSTQVFLPESSVKWTVEIRNWTFVNPSNIISVNFGLSSNADSEQALEFVSDSTYVLASNDLLLYTQLAPLSIVDGQLSTNDIYFKSLQNNSFAAIIPAFQDYAIVDPNFSVLAGSKNFAQIPSDKNWPVWQTAVIVVAGFLTVVMLVLAVITKVMHKMWIFCQKKQDELVEVEF